MNQFEKKHWKFFTVIFIDVSINKAKTVKNISSKNKVQTKSAGCYNKNNEDGK